MTTRSVKCSSDQKRFRDVDWLRST